VNNLINTSNINVDQIKRVFKAFLLMRVDKKLIWVELIYGTNCYILLQYILIHLILISIKNPNIIILRIWRKFSLDQETEPELKEILSRFWKHLHIAVSILFLNDW
jgi:hypothetical protein